MLIEALPWLEEFAGQRIVIKYGKEEQSKPLALRVGAELVGSFIICFAIYAIYCGFYKYIYRKNPP